MARIDEEIGKIVQKYAVNNNVLGSNLDYDLHFFSIFVIKEYSKAVTNVKDDSYELPEEIRYGG